MGLIVELNFALNAVFVYKICITHAAVKMVLSVFNKTLKRIENKGRNAILLIFISSAELMGLNRRFNSGSCHHLIKPLIFRGFFLFRTIAGLKQDMQ